MVFSQDRVQQRLGPSFMSRTLTFQFCVVGGGGGVAEVFKVLVQRVSSSSSSHSPGAVDERFTGFFSHFSPKQKSARLGPHSGSELPPRAEPIHAPSPCRAHVAEEDEPVTGSESEVEEDCDLWWDEAGRQWTRTAAFPWEVVLAWNRLRWGDLVGRARGPGE